MNETKRFRFIQDNDSHWFMIPAHTEGLFWEWVEYMENGGDYDGDDFDQYMMNGGTGDYSFENPQED